MFRSACNGMNRRQKINISKNQDKRNTELIEPSECKEVYTFKPYVFFKIKYHENHWPKARSGHRIVSNENYIFAYGGYNPDLMTLDIDVDTDENLDVGPLFREVWKFNIAKEKWSKVMALNIPYVLASNAVILQGSVLMVYGGTGVPFGQRSSNTLYVCNLNDELPSFREVTVIGEIPEPQYGQAVFVYKNFFYVIGGTTGYDYSCDVHRLDLVTGKWKVMHLNRGSPFDPPGRYRHELGLQLYKKKVFILGGGTAQRSFGLKNLPVYDLDLNEWSTASTVGDPKVVGNSGYPKARRFHSLVQATEGDVFITGGESPGNGVYQDTWKLNLETLQWTRIDSMRLKRGKYFHAATLSPQGKMYLFGGISQDKRTEEMLCAWLCIPKLQEICWEAVKHYNLVDGLSKNALQQLIPPEFVQRLE